MKNRILLTLTAVALTGCARYIPDVRVIPDEPKPVSINVFTVYMLHKPAYASGNEELNRNMLSSWWDMLYLAQIGKGPAGIAVSGPLIRELLKISEEVPRLPDILGKPASELSAEEADYLLGKYFIDPGTGDLVSAQIAEALSYLGHRLQREPVIRNILRKSDYDDADRETLAGFIKEKISGFDSYIKSVLDLEYVHEAATSLSYSYLPLLDPERVKVQILEGLVNYKRWRGGFPDGFIPRGGYIDSESVSQLERTGLRWITAAGSSPVVFLTEPQIIPVLDEDNVHGVSALVSDDPAVFLEMDRKKFRVVSYDDYLAGLNRVSPDAVNISTSPFIPVEVPSTPRLEKVRKLLADAGSAIQRYRNSGRASVRILSAAQRLLFDAESGEAAEPEHGAAAERLFRASLVDIYRNINLPCPAELFIPLEDPGAVAPERQISSLLEITCDGKVSSDEWFGSAYHSFNSTFSVKWGYDRSNLYVAVISTVPFESAGVLIGHMDVNSAAGFPRGRSGTEVGFPLYIEAGWTSRRPERAVLYRTSGNENWEVLSSLNNVGHSEGILEMGIPFRYIDARAGKNIFMKFYVDGEIFPEAGRIEIPAPAREYRRGIISYVDPGGDNRGPGNYSIPDELAEYSGCFDFRGIEVHELSTEKVISLEFSNLDNPFQAPLGFSPQVVDVYIDVNGRAGLGNTSLLDGRKAFTAPDDAWEYCISISGWDKAVYNSAGKRIGDPQISVDSVSRTINIFVDNSIIPAPVETWGVIPVLLAGDREGEIIEVTGDGDKTVSFTGRRNASDTNILDVILPAGYSQSRVLGANRRGGAIEIPALRKR